MFELILLTSFVSLGLYVSGSPSYILFPVRARLAKLLGGYWKIDGEDGYFDFHWVMFEWWKPIWGCPPCMASFWGIVVFLVFGDNWIELPFVILGASALNFILFHNFIQKHL